MKYMGKIAPAIALVSMLEAPIANVHAQSEIYTGIVKSSSRIDIEPRHFRIFLGVVEGGIYTVRCYDPEIMDELEKKIRDGNRFEFRLKENKLTVASDTCSNILDAINQN